MAKPDFTLDAHSMKMEVSKLKRQLIKTDEYAAELEVKRDVLQKSLDECTNKVLSLSKKLVEANERSAALEQCVIKFRQGVTHFNRTRGDMNLLLTAYVDSEQLRKEQSHD